MESPELLTLCALFLLVGALYSSVGHAGASGYLAVMALMGVPAESMRPTALAINILVAVIALVQFARAGHFAWRTFLPLAVLSVPCAFLGAAIPIGEGPLRVAIGAVLVVTAARMAWTALRPMSQRDQIRHPPVAAGIACGAAIGFIAGMTGTGGGIFLSPLLLLLGWADTQRTAAVSAAFILVNSIAGTTGQLAGGWRPDSTVAVLAIAACIGGLVGSHLGARRLTGANLRVLLSVVLLLAGAKLLAL